jgi:hypothetical protein
LSDPKPPSDLSSSLLELDQLDLLSGDTSSFNRSDVDVSTFSARIQKRFDEQKEVQKREDEGARLRQYFLLSALLRARKVLRGVAKLKLGNLVDLEIICDDFQGWPRILLTPNHIEDDLIDLPNFEVTGGERPGFVEVTIRIPGSSFKEELLISKEEDLLRIARILKRNLRLYLDQLTDEIIKPRQRTVAVKAEPTAVKALHEGAALKEVDLFEEGTNREVLETLPQLEEIQALKGFE